MIATTPVGRTSNQQSMESFAAQLLPRYTHPFCFFWLEPDEQELKTRFLILENGRGWLVIIVISTTHCCRSCLHFHCPFSRHRQNINVTRSAYHTCFACRFHHHYHPPPPSPPPHHHYHFCDGCRNHHGESQLDHLAQFYFFVAYLASSSIVS